MKKIKGSSKGKPPSAPFNVRVDDVGENYIDISWSSSPAQRKDDLVITNYIVELGEERRKLQPVLIVKAPQNSGRISKLEINKTYTLGVRSINSHGLSSDVCQPSVRVQMPSAETEGENRNSNVDHKVVSVELLIPLRREDPNISLPEPEYLNVQSLGKNFVCLAWHVDEDQQNDVDEYLIEWKTVEEDWTISTTIKPAIPTGIVEGLIKGQKYQLRVRAVNGEEKSDEGSSTVWLLPIQEKKANDDDGASGSSVIESNLCPPDAPCDLIVIGKVEKNAKLTWTIPSILNTSSITGYIIEVWENGVWKISSLHESVETEKRIYGLNMNKQYKFRIRAYNKHGVSSICNESAEQTAMRYPSTSKDDASGFARPNRPVTSGRKATSNITETIDEHKRKLKVVEKLQEGIQKRKQAELIAEKDMRKKEEASAANADRDGSTDSLISQLSSNPTTPTSNEKKKQRVSESPEKKLSIFKRLFSPRKNEENTAKFYLEEQSSRNETQSSASKDEECAESDDIQKAIFASLTDQKIQKTKRQKHKIIFDGTQPSTSRQGMYDPDDDDDDDTNSTASVTSGRRRRLSTNFAPVNEDSSCSSFTGKFKILDLDLRSCEEMLVDAEHEAMEIDQQQPATDSSLKKRKVASTDKGTPPVIKKAKKISRHSSPTAAGAKDRVTKLKEDKIKQVEKKVEGKRKQQPSKPTTSKAKNRGGNASDDDEPMIVDESSETCEEEGKSSKERMKESNKKKGKLKARIQKRKVQKSYAIYMSLNSILQKDDNNVMKNKIEHDVRNSSRMKILTAIFVNYLMNKPDCRLAEEYAITGFEHYRIMNCFKERTENVYNNCKKKDPELYQLFEEFKKEMADEENEIDQLLFKKFEELHGKKKWWQKNQERLEEYNKFRIEMLTIVNCKFETDLLLQASREMDKDLRVHLHQQGPKMLLKYLKFKEFGIPQQEESDKKKVPEKDKKLVEKKTKKNEKRLENFKKKGNQRKEENQRREGIIPTSEELKQARKNKQQSAREKAKAAYTKKPCKNQEIKKITKQLKRDENKSEKERERNQRERIRKKEEKIEKRKQKNENKEQIFTFKKSGKKECWTSKEMKEKNKNVEKALINLLIYDMCYDDTLYGYLEDIQRKTEELKEIRLKREKEKEEKKKKKVNQEQNDKGKKEKKLEKIEKEEVGLLNFQDLDIPHLCYKFLPLFMRMQRELVDSGAKGFVLFPMKRFGLHHATYTETVLERDVLNYLKNLTTESTEKEQVDKIREKLIKVDPTEREKEKNVAKLKKKYDNLKTLWEALFDLKKVKDKHKNKRACSVPRCMQTDGVKVSLIFDLKKEKQEEETLPSSGNQKKTKKKKKIKYQRFVGLDPGLKAMFGGGMREDDPHIKKDERTKKVDKKQHTLIYANTKTFRFRNGELRRKSLLHKYSKDIDERYNNFMKKNEKYNKVDKNDPTKYLLLAKFYLKQFEIKQDKLTERCFRNLKFNKLIMVQREMDRVVNFIMGDNVKKEPCFVAIGSTKINPCMKGHVKTPIMKIEKRLRERSKQVGEERLKVVSAYEGYTTKMCSSCNQKNIVSRSPKRYAFCQNCHVVWNRDVNAGINILNIALINEEILEAADIPNSEVFPGIISATDM